MAEHTGDGPPPTGKLTEPSTREEALSRADDWANGALSHWGEFKGMTAPGEPIGTQNSAHREARLADLVEANRYTMLATMLPTEEEMEIRLGLRQLGPPDHPEMTPSQVELLDQLADALATVIRTGALNLASLSMQPEMHEALGTAKDRARQALDGYTREVGREGTSAVVDCAIAELVE